MKKFDPYWVSLAVIIFGVVLICLPLVYFDGWKHGVSHYDLAYIMSMIATIAMKLVGGLLVAAGLLSLTISEIFKKP
ncbi:MAG: hypothetical protein FWD31_01985 [Planctomycetaceae bacterium]|nr:hypothetical protein [Planctomycetaceae bacterium]